MRIAVAGEETLQLNGLSRRAVAEHNNGRHGALDNSNPSPDAGLRDQVRDVSLRSHQALEFRTGNSQKNAVTDSVGVYQGLA